MKAPGLQFIFIVSFIINLSALSFSQELTYPEGSPEWLIHTFFKSENFLDKEKYFTGEMKNEISYPTIGEELKGKGEIVFYIFDSTAQKKVFAVNLKTDSKDLDFYCFLSDSTGGWKLEAVRRFLFPKFIYTVTDSLSELDSMSASDSSMLKILKLMTTTDEGLKNHLKNNIASFEKLVKCFNEKNKDSVAVMIHELSLNGIFRDENYPGCIFIQIAALESREIGYTYKPDEAVLPKVSFKKFIFIGEIIPDWFLYRLM